LYLARVQWFAVLIAVAACASSVPSAAPREDGSLVVRSYTIEGDAPAALLVALHYSSGAPSMWDELVAGWGAALRVAFPRGPFAHRRTGYTWFAPDHEQKDDAGKLADVERVTERVARTIRDLRAAHPEIRRVAVTGFSYGGDIAWMLAIRHPDLVDLAIPMGSRLLGEPTGASANVHVLHGDADPIIDARTIAARVAALAQRGVPITLTMYPGLGHDISPALIADWRARLHAVLDRP
jgi:phospholipase/carboxylesterase